VASGYLGRLRERTAWTALRRQIVFGLVGGWLLLVLGAFRHFYVATARAPVSWAMLAAGAVLLALGVARPAALARVESGLRSATSWIGKGILLAFLSVTYFAVITPVGLAWRALRGPDPFQAWQVENEDSPREMGDGPRRESREVPREARPLSRWVPKSVVDDPRSPAAEATRRSFASQPFVVIGYFVRNGHYMLLPVLIFLLVAGLVLYFVKSSALAPFLYTLF